jgi:hypothetical protein
MPFRSRAQIRKFAALVKAGKISQAVFDEWLRATPNVKNLPARVKVRKKKSKRKKA